MQPTPSDPVVEYLTNAAGSRTSREISEATRVPLRRVQKRLRELRDAHLVSKSGRRYAVITIAAPPAATSTERTTEPPPVSVRRPRSLAQLSRSMLADLDPAGSNERSR